VSRLSLTRTEFICYDAHSGHRMSEVLPEPNREDLLHLDIDCRLSWLWVAIWQTEDWDVDTVAGFVRYAYGQGYWEALTEARRGSLYRIHGYPIPKRQPKDKSS
jgi:hypothetical protein